jgi:FHA domain
MGSAAPAAPAEGPPMDSSAPSAPAEVPPMSSTAPAAPAEAASMSATVAGPPDLLAEPSEASPPSVTSDDPWGSDDDGPDTEPMPAVEDGDEQPLQVGLAVDRSTDSREADLESKSAGVADDILEADTQLMEVPIEHPAFDPQLHGRQQAAATQAAMPPPVATDVDDTPPTLPLSSSPRTPLPQDPSTESLIMAADCPHGHSNPPAAATCRMCGAAIAPQRPRLIHRPVLCVLQASDGTTADVDRAVLVGRAPDPDRSNFKAPRLMSVQSPGHDISRTHVEVAPEGWQVIAIDLNSTNGTVLIRPGGYERQQLAPGEHVPVQPGSVLDLGDGVSITVALPS